MIHQRLHLLQGIALLATLALPSHAAVLFTEDFEDLTANANLSGTNSGSFAVTSNLQSVVRDESTSTVFGTPNQYLELFDTVGNNGFQIQSAEYSQTANAVTTFQFDFYEPSGGGGANLNVGFARGDINTSGSRARVFLNDGVVDGLSTTGTTSYSLDTVYTFYMILNDTDNPVAYGGGTLAANTADIWLQQSGGGSPYFAGSRTATGQKDTTNGYSVGFRTFNGDLQDAIVDNVTLFEGAAAIPEPSSLGFAAIAGLFLLRRRR
ncbi:PEP-CTERM sorting domain-containing protein [Haloferula sp. A504]|uniref:PEP-CTERM sorting domain-containing protein n=1 Tax=Haloferula sp. A504 TaxID=3373601 RepID=UPI0031BF9A64|nr:PEP-CTERM sorting domain-containing protein [Verrucomicrobiaceae bacterium E54]